MRKCTWIKTISESMVFRLLFISLVLHTATYAVIGFSSEGHYYSETIKRYFNYPYHVRKGVLTISQQILLYLNYNARIVNSEFIYNARHGGIHMAYSCLGFGVMALWTGFIIAAKPMTVKQKALYLLAGLAVINVLNVFRIIIIFISHRKLLCGIDQHDLFNMLLHITVLLMGMAVMNRNGKALKANMSR